MYRVDAADESGEFFLLENRQRLVGTVVHHEDFRRMLRGGPPQIGDGVAQRRLLVAGRNDERDISYNFV